MTKQGFSSKEQAIEGLRKVVETYHGKREAPKSVLTSESIQAAVQAIRNSIEFISIDPGDWRDIQLRIDNLSFPQIVSEGTMREEMRDLSGLLMTILFEVKRKMDAEHFSARY